MPGELSVVPGELSVVGGAGRVGGALAAAARRSGRYARVAVRTRQGGEGLAASGPVVVCTPAGALDAAVAELPRARVADLVLVQNGVLRPWLAARGLSGGAVTEVVLRLAADGETLTPAGGGGALSAESVAFGGRHAASMAALLPACRLAASEGELREQALFKLAWACAVPLLCDALGPGAAVGELFDGGEVEGELKALVAEMVRVAAPDALGDDMGSAAAMASHGDAAHGDAGEAGKTRLELSALADVFAYSAGIAHARPSAALAEAEWAWRNGWLLARGGGAAAQPLHRRWIERAPSLRHLLAC